MLPEKLYYVMVWTFILIHGNILNIEIFIRLKVHTMKKHLIYGLILIITTYFAVGVGSIPVQADGCYTFTRNLRPGTPLTAQELSALQSAFVSEGVWSSYTPFTSYDHNMATAVSLFQEKHAKETLRPFGLVSGNGIVGTNSRLLLNKLYGCGSTRKQNTSTRANMPIVTNNAPSSFCPPGYNCTPKTAEVAFKAVTPVVPVTQAVLPQTQYTQAKEQTVDGDNGDSEPITVTIQSSQLPAQATETLYAESSLDGTPDVSIGAPIVSTSTSTTTQTCDPSSPQASIYIMMGQSNANGVGKISQIPANVNADFDTAAWPFKIWYKRNETSWKVGSDIKTIQGKYFGPDLTIAYSLMQSGERDFYMFKYAKGGTSLDGNWKSRGKHGLYDKAIVSLNRAKDAICATGKYPVVKALFWMQGEADAVFPAMAVKYSENLKRFISQSREDYVGNAPIVIGLIDTRPGLWIYGNQVRSQQRSVASNTLKVGYVNTNDLSVYPSPCSIYLGAECKAHYNTASVLKLGERFYDKYLSL